MAASATFALKAGVWFRRGRPLIVSPDCWAQRVSVRNSTYGPVQILGAGPWGRQFGDEMKTSAKYQVCRKGVKAQPIGEKKPS
jgi:hypothetical protein